MKRMSSLLNGLKFVLDKNQWHLLSLFPVLGVGLSEMNWPLRKKPSQFLGTPNVDTMILALFVLLTLKWPLLLSCAVTLSLRYLSFLPTNSSCEISSSGQVWGLWLVLIESWQKQPLEDRILCWSYTPLFPLHYPWQGVFFSVEHRVFSGSSEGQESSNNAEGCVQAAWLRR